MVAERMLAGEIEHTRYLRNPLDVLAQQIVAMCAVEERGVDELLDTIRRAAPFAELSADVYLAVLDMLAGRYPSDGFAELRPRVVWDWPPVPSERVTAPAGSRRRAARSPIVGCSRSSWSTAPGSVSSTRRWSTRAAAAT